MSARSAAQTHVTKAREFLEAAEWNLEGELYNAAASNAVTSGINCKDAICLVLTGRSAKSDQHTAAVAELRAALGVNAVGAVQGPTPPTAPAHMLPQKHSEAESPGRCQEPASARSASTSASVVDQLVTNRASPTPGSGVGST